jgi:membrane peptidoglycan carboxypeptidase
VTAKRRAEGPAVKRKPKPPGNTKRRALKALKWFLIVSLAGTLILIGGFVYLYQTTSIPNPNKDFQTQSSFVYYADGKSQVGQYATQNRQSGVGRRRVPRRSRSST